MPFQNLGSVTTPHCNRDPDRVFFVQPLFLFLPPKPKTTMTRKNVLFLCTGNSCRSQMAEGWARHFHGDSIQPYSAGIEAHGMNPNAMAVMKEAGVDISSQSSKLADTVKDVPLDLVITVCGHADENCPMFLTKAKTVHVGFDDPPKLAKEAKTEEEALDAYRRVRDEIRDFIQNQLPEKLREV